MENWTSDPTNGTVYMEKRFLDDPLQAHACIPRNETNHDRYKRFIGKKFIPYRDFRHFTGSQKPWQMPRQRKIKTEDDLKDFNNTGI